MSPSRLSDSSTAPGACLVSDVVLPPSAAQRLCDAAGVLVCWLPSHVPRIEAALVYLLAGGTIRRGRRCRCRRTFCLHDAARLLLGQAKVGR